MHRKGLSLYIHNAGQKSALTTPRDRVNRTCISESVGSSQSSCIPRAVGAAVAPTTRAECGIRAEAGPLAAVGFSSSVSRSRASRIVRTLLTMFKYTTGRRAARSFSSDRGAYRSWNCFCSVGLPLSACPISSSQSAPSPPKKLAKQTEQEQLNVRLAAPLVFLILPFSS